MNPTTIRIACSVLAGRPRSFRADAVRMVARLRPPPRVLGSPPRLDTGGWVVVANHYHSPTFQAWWIALVLTASIDRDIRWVMTDAWTYPDTLRSKLVSPASRRLFRRMAGTYGFFSMPPMPPRPHEVEARAATVRSVLRYIAHEPRPLLGLVPEGGDSADGSLARPPAGAGRFLGHLAARGLRFVIAGVYEDGDTACLRFGAPLELETPHGLSASARDQACADTVMQAIAHCLPPSLHGPYAREIDPHDS